MIKKKIRFGVIGCSSVAERKTIPAILESKYSEVRRIGSRSQEKAKKFSKKFSCENYGSYEEVLKDESVDAVYISLPIALQEKWIKEAAKHGKHVLCEKSISISLKSVKRILEQCKRYKVRVMEGFSYRFHDQHENVMRQIQLNKIGTPRIFTSEFFLPISYNKKNFRFNKKLGGGSLNDVGCYLISASRILLQESPKKIFCMLEENKNEIDITGTIVVIFENNKLSYCNFGYEKFFQSNYKIKGETGRITLNNAYNIPKEKPSVVEIFSHDKIKKIRIKPANQTKLMIDAFCQDIIIPKSAKFNFEKDLLIQAKMMDAARTSYIKKKFISITGS